MLTQQDIYASSSETCPPMLNKDNYVPWSSHLLRYAKSRPNRKLIYNSILNGPYVRRMIPKIGDPDHEVPVNETFHEQTDEDLTEKELKQVESDDQAIQTILLGSNIGIQEKKAKLFNKWEMFTSTDGESIESYYHRFSKLMNDFKRSKHFPEMIANNLKFLNNLQPEWKRHVTIVHQTKDLHEVDYTQLYDFLKYNQMEFRIRIGNGNIVAARAEGPRRRDAAYFQTQLLIAQKEESGIQLQAEEFDLMVAARDLDEIEEVNANCILMANLHIEQGVRTVEQNPATVEKTRAYFESLYNNLAIEVEKQAQQKQQSLYNGKVLLEKHDPLVVYDSEETLQLAHESRLKMKQLNKEKKPANYAKINHLSRVFVSQTVKSHEELYFSNTSKTFNVSKSISIANEEFSDDTTPSVA
ncbi:hypothetical protein Tco_0636959 [Tanacetum coccineum]